MSILPLSKKALKELKKGLVYGDVKRIADELGTSLEEVSMTLSGARVVERVIDKAIEYRDRNLANKAAKEDKIFNPELPKTA